jgi:hypothetical protein
LAARVCFKKLTRSWTWAHTSIIPAAQEVEAGGYSLGLAWAKVVRSCLKNKSWFIPSHSKLAYIVQSPGLKLQKFQNFLFFLL